MQTGLKIRMEFLFNRHGDGRAVCVATDHGYMGDATENVARLHPITEAIIRGGVDGILFSPGQAIRLEAQEVGQHQQRRMPSRLQGSRQGQAGLHIAARAVGENGDTHVG